ncbi:MAG: DUF1294 domain-containing protein [Clostridia bacterium]|nr:DUF1294 domain-containing protein [Clostridia bacterium]
MLKIYLIVIGVISLITFIAFAIDKRQAKEERRRIPEAILLALMDFGGAVGGLIGMYALRHKTIFKTKFHFVITAWLASILQIAILIYIMVV